MQTEIKPQFLTVQQVAAAYNVKPATIWNWVNPKNKRHVASFPKPCKLSKGITRWKAADIQAHIDSFNQEAL
ncbi:helix-turn-helix transcriptional regulator [Neisseriaceae bacterium B1]